MSDEVVEAVETLRLRIARFDIIVAMIQKDKFLREMLSGYLEALQ